MGEEAMQGLMPARPLLVSANLTHAGFYHHDTEFVSCGRG
jgi:hypothetical protein